MNERKYTQEINKVSEFLTFGKYKFQTIQHLLRTHPSYLNWLKEEKVVKFSQEIVDKLEDAMADLWEAEPLDYGEYPELHYGDR